MTKEIKIGNLNCLCSSVINRERIAYILYPLDILPEWIEQTAEKHNVTIVVITGMDWQNVFSPWPAPGVTKGEPDFKGESAEFLKLLQSKVVPEVERASQINSQVERNLVGVSMSGLFALWQWMECDTFSSIASLSGSFWYEGFIEWMQKIKIPPKTGKGFFLLGDKESHSKVKAFNSVGINTSEIIKILQTSGINAEFESVPGNHFANGMERLEKAYNSLYCDTQQR